MLESFIVCIKGKASSEAVADALLAVASVERYLTAQAAHRRTIAEVRAEPDALARWFGRVDDFNHATGEYVPGALLYFHRAGKPKAAP